MNKEYKVYHLYKESWSYERDIDTLLEDGYIVIYETKNRLLLAPCNVGIMDFYCITKYFYPCAYVVNTMIYKIGYINI